MNALPCVSTACLSLVLSLGANAQCKQEIGHYDVPAWGAFGNLVGGAGEQAMILEANATGGNGRLYVLDQHSLTGQWVPQQMEVLPGVAGAHDLAISEALGWAAVGQTNALAGGQSLGEVRMLRRDGSGQWTYVSDLVAPTAVPGNDFGVSLAFLEDQLFVGEPGGGAGGQVHVFELDATQAWQPVGLLSGLDTQGLDRFGQSLDTDHGRLVVGAPGTSSSSGAAYVFEPNGALGTWMQVRRLTAGNPQRSSGFGEQV